MSPVYGNQQFIYMIDGILENMASASGISSLVSLAVYVFSSLAVYTIAQRRGIKHAWMAWVPLINVWILGSISDQYRYVVKGQVKSKRKVLLTVNILNCVFTCIAVINLIATIITVIMSQNSFAGEEKVIRQALTSIVFFAPVLVLGIVAFVVETMALYDLYTSCEPANNVLYLVLSLIPGINQITRPLFLFLCRNQDNGMPPRRASAADNPVEF